LRGNAASTLCVLFRALPGTRSVPKAFPRKAWERVFHLLKIINAAKQKACRHIAIVGGVAANRRLRNGDKITYPFSEKECKLQFASQHRKLKFALRNGEVISSPFLREKVAIDASKEKFGSPCKIVRVNKINGLHPISLNCEPVKSTVYMRSWSDFIIPALFCRDYQKFDVYIPSLKLCGDNAAMIASTGWHYLKTRKASSPDADVYLRLRI